MSVSGSSNDSVFSASNPLAVLKQCTSFDMLGLSDASLIRVKTGALPEILGASEDFISAMQQFGVSINDKRSVSLSEWKPTNSEMLQIAEQKIKSEMSAVPDAKPIGPKLS